MVKVTYKGDDFISSLSSAAIINTLEEIQKIIEIVKSKKYTHHKELINDIKQLVDDLDPSDKKGTISCIIENIHPEQRDLFDPVNIILEQKPKRKWLRCFL